MLGRAHYEIRGNLHVSLTLYHIQTSQVVSSLAQLGRWLPRWLLAALAEPAIVYWRYLSYLCRTQGLLWHVCHPVRKYAACSNFEEASIGILGHHKQKTRLQFFCMRNTRQRVFDQHNNLLVFCRSSSSVLSGAQTLCGWGAPGYRICMHQAVRIARPHPW